MGVHSASSATAVPSVSMDDAAAGLKTKSDKIRALARAGYSRSDIARHLGLRYQHVRNVLVDEDRRGQQSSAPSAVPETANRSQAPESRPAEPVRLFVGTGGGVWVPESVVRAVGLNEGDPVIAALEDGVIFLMGVPAAVRRAQAIVRRSVPEGVSLVDGLVAERRAESRRDDVGE